jgi:hypothetical protein
VMNDASSDAKKRIALATSSGSPSRPIGWAFLISSKYSEPPGSSGKRLTLSVLIVPGATALTRMPRSAHSMAKCFVIPVATNLAGPYVACRFCRAIPEIEKNRQLSRHLF